MKILPSLLALALAIQPSLLAESSQADALQANDLVAICGDSITEQKLYSLYMANYFLLCQPAPKLQAIQFGWGGETAGGFIQRMKPDALSFKPTVATTCYGMNDGGYAAVSEGMLKSYRQNMEAVLKNFKEGGVRFIVLGGPGVVDSTKFKRPNATAEVYNETLATLSRTVQEIATQNGVGFADVHGAMKEAMVKGKAKYGDDYHVGGGDGVHPAANGQLAMAYAFLKALGCSGDLGSFTLDLQSGKAMATGGHRILSSDKGVAEIESTQYPFCFTGKPEDPNATSGVIEFIPFNQDLNRLTLVVKNATSEKLKVTWGEESKEFTAAQLAEGINLAAEFLKNPFSAPFANAQKMIREQQGFETIYIKDMFPALRRMAKALPEEAEAVEKLRQSVVKRLTEAQAASRAAVVPVKHRLQIEAI